MTHILSLIAFLFLCAEKISSACAQEDTDKPIITIGVVLPLTGNLGFVGQDARRGIELAVEDRRKTFYRYRLIFEDNQGLPANTLRAGKRLLDTEQVDAIITLWSPSTLILAPLCEKAKKILYTIQWDPQIGKTYHYTLSHQVLADMYVRSTLKLLQTQGYHSISFYEINHAGFNMGAEILTQEAPKFGIRIIQTETFDPDEKDFLTRLTRSRVLAPDALLIWAEMPQIEIILQQAHQIVPNIPVTGFFDALPNLYLVPKTTYVSEIGSTKQFAHHFRERYGENFKLKAPNAYDIYELLVEAYEQYPDKKPSSDQIINYLTKSKIRQGSVGDFTIDEHGNSSYEPKWRTTFNK